MSHDPRPCEVVADLHNGWDVNWGVDWDDDDDGSFSHASTAPDNDTVFSASENGYVTDELELYPIDEGDSDGDNDDQRSELSWQLSCAESTSVCPSVFEDEVAHGRRYHGYRKGRYPLPNDRREQQREEANHAMMLELTGGHLLYSDIGEHPQKIIDIGTGTGSWAIDVADLYPSASVIGTDLSAIQPKWVPVNVRMFVDDCEEPDWLHGSGYDLVHFRGMAGVLHDLDGVLAKAYPRIRNGGWVEFHEVVPQILCDDGTMGPDDPLRIFYDAAVQGLRTFGCDPMRTANLEEILDRAGFTNIRCVTKKIPISTWAHERHLKILGLFMKAVMLDSLDGLAAKPLAALGVSRQDRRELVKHVKKSLEDRSVHRYVNCCFCYGQKKEQFVLETES
ncbi:mRNA 3'-end-processing protein YTH1 [Tolypocladium capitatum]|uniref:mRNA 3'-end-processing protein YTH1 n=1 Tax=Tolypocladium capitatum TaxID=45235 RepID=A0A2K3QKJ8_9HYPO|nr:mRNA 3'-end-processing protein YTH1 [Tolypocladium capitatum]